MIQPMDGVEQPPIVTDATVDDSTITEAPATRTFTTIRGTPTTIETTVVITPTVKAESTSPSSTSTGPALQTQKNGATDRCAARVLVAALAAVAVVGWC